MEALDLTELTQKTETLSVLLQQPMSKNKRALDKAYRLLKDLLNCFYLDIDARDENGLSIIDIDFFQKKFCSIASEKEIIQFFSLFLKVKKLAYKINNIVLDDTEINKRIQPKFCKVVSAYGDGTGYIIDDTERLILSSFHLIGAVKPLKITTEIRDNYILSILHAAKYIDEEFRLTKKALEIASKEIFLSEIEKAEVGGYILKNVKLDPKDIEDILAIPEQKTWMKKELLNAQTSLTHVFCFNQKNKNQLKIACALSNAGYLDEKFALKPVYLTCDLTTIKIIPSTQTFHILIDNIDNNVNHIEEIKKYKSSILTNEIGLSDCLFNFFMKGKDQKDIILLAETVEIHCDGEVLLGRVDLPKEISLSDKQKVLKNFYYFDTVPIKITHFSENLPFDKGNKRIHTGEKIAPFSSDEQLVIGEKVYFGGFPLTQQEYTFSTGIISSINEYDNKTSFVIEAPIAPGNSGSPVFVQRKGELYWIGVINSEVARVTEKMFEVKEKLERASGEIIRVGDFALLEGMKEITTTLLDNLSTGKGKANGVGDFRKLWQVDLFTDYEFSIDPYLDFLVPRKTKPGIKLSNQDKKLSTNTIPVIHDIFKYQGEVFYLNGDKHNNKHLRLSHKIEAELSSNNRYLKESWGKKDATFNLHCAGRYKEILKEVIKAVVKNNLSSDFVSNFVRYTCPVGWDKGKNKEGEETRVIELYYGEDGLGSHIRPKAESWLSPKEIIDICLLHDLQENLSEHSASTSTSMNPNSVFHQKEKKEGSFSINDLLKEAKHSSNQGLTTVEFTDFKLAGTLQKHLFDKLEIFYEINTVEPSEFNQTEKIKRYQLTLPQEEFDKLEMGVRLQT